VGRIEISTEIKAPIENVFAFLADPRNYEKISIPETWPRWMAMVKRASSSGPRAHWVYEMSGMKVESDTEVTELAENRIYAFRQTRGFMKSAANRLEIEPTTEGSRVRWTLEYELPYSYLGRLIDSLRARKQLETAVDQSIKNLHRMLRRQSIT